MGNVNVSITQQDTALFLWNLCMRVVRSVQSMESVTVFLVPFFRIKSPSTSYIYSLARKLAPPAHEHISTWTFAPHNWRQNPMPLPLHTQTQHAALHVLSRKNERKSSTVSSIVENYVFCELFSIELRVLPAACCELDFTEFVADMFSWWWESEFWLHWWRVSN